MINCDCVQRFWQLKVLINYVWKSWQLKSLFLKFLLSSKSVQNQL